MSYISVFDMLKIGVGPSSSHTLGPWKASQKFLQTLKRKGFFEQVNRIKITLYGSLSLTGKGHATDLAVMLGLCGFKPETISTESIKEVTDKIQANKILNLNNEHSINFYAEEDIEFSKVFLPFHPNGIRFIAILQNNSAFSETYFSIGGGFILKEGETSLQKSAKTNVPFEISTGKHIENYLKQNPSFNIYDFARKNELALGKSEEKISKDLLKIWDVMSSAIFTGVITEGVLPGGLNVKRRAYNLSFNLLSKYFTKKEDFFKCIKQRDCSFIETLDFINLFALATNEVNADLGRVVTAPTNGSAGVIPAVLAYYLFFINKNAGKREIENFLLTAGLIGGIFKSGATISAAAGGCQAEIGVSSSMAAAALTEMQGGSPEQAMVAAEIAMEHHLGMTCDPVDGLVQIPCIERNAMGAIKAINASNLALKTNPTEVKIPLDFVVNAMLETANDMNIKYKETSMGGLAKISVKNTDC